MVAEPIQDLAAQGALGALWEERDAETFLRCCSQDQGSPNRRWVRRGRFQPGSSYWELVQFEGEAISMVALGTGHVQGAHIAQVGEGFGAADGCRRFASTTNGLRDVPPTRLPPLFFRQVCDWSGARLHP